jgi:hypothetical protein
MKVEILKKDSGALHMARRGKTMVTAEDAKLVKSLTLHQCQVLLLGKKIIIDTDVQCSSKQKKVLLKSQEN